jgi:hypothetical protein
MPASMPRPTVAASTSRPTAFLLTHFAPKREGRCPLIAPPSAQLERGLFGQSSQRLEANAGTKPLKEGFFPAFAARARRSSPGVESNPGREAVHDPPTRHVALGGWPQDRQRAGTAGATRLRKTTGILISTSVVSSGHGQISPKDGGCGRTAGSDWSLRACLFRPAAHSAGLLQSVPSAQPITLRRNSRAGEGLFEFQRGSRKP